MHGLEHISKDPSEREVDIEAYAAQLSAKLALSGLSVLRYGLNLATRAEDIVGEIAIHRERAPVSPELPELHDWLKRATVNRVGLESRDLEGPRSSDRDIIAILARFEGPYRDAEDYYEVY